MEMLILHSSFVLLLEPGRVHVLIIFGHFEEIIWMCYQAYLLTVKE